MGLREKNNILKKINKTHNTLGKSNGTFCVTDGAATSRTNKRMFLWLLNEIVW